MKNIIILSTTALLIAALIAALNLGYLKIPTPKTATAQLPSSDFILGFEAGVRYGLIAKIQYPDEDSIHTLTTQAKILYWMVEKEDKNKHTTKPKP